MGRVGLINSGGESKGASDLAEAVRTAVINKRAGGPGLISGRKAFQRPMAEGVELLNAIQDVYLDASDHHRLSVAPDGRQVGRIRPCAVWSPSTGEVSRRQHVDLDHASRGRWRMTDTARPRRTPSRAATGSSSASPATPATACSSPATASRSVSAAVRQRPGDAARLPGRDPGPRRHAGRGLGFQVHISDHDITTPGDAPERAGGDEPGGAQGRPATGSSRAAR